MIEHVYDAVVLAGLRSAVEELEIPLDGDVIAEACALLDRLTAKVSLAVAEFDAAGLWELDAATSAVAWLRSRAGMTASVASTTVRTGNRMKQLPRTADAWLSGELSSGQVRAITANVEDRTVAMFADQERELLPYLVPLDVTQTATAMRHWRVRAEALLDEADTAAPERSLHLSRTLGGRFELSGSLDALGGEVVATALRLATTDDVEGEPSRTPAQRRADALVDLSRFYVEHHQDLPRSRNRPHVNVVVDYDALVAGRGGESVEGTPLDAASLRTLLCDAEMHRVVTGGGSAILDYGTGTRVVSQSLWNALVLRDRHCRFEGCDRPSRLCEAHHVVPWSQDGPTSLDNLVLKCSRHHHIGHLPGWHERLEPDGTLVTTDPKGRTRTTRPPGILREFPQLGGRLADQ